MLEKIISEVGSVLGPPTDGSDPIVFTCCCPRAFRRLHARAKATSCVNSAVTLAQ